MKIIKKSFILVFSILFISLIMAIQGFSSNAEGTTVRIKASKINEKIDWGDNTILIMDVDLTTDSIEADNLTITGSHKLTINKIEALSLTLKSGSNVEVRNGNIEVGDLGYRCERDYAIVIEKDAKLNVIQDANYIVKDNSSGGNPEYCLFSYGHIKSSGNVSIRSNYYNGIRSECGITIDGGSFFVNCPGESYTDIYLNKHSSFATGVTFLRVGTLNIIDGKVSMICKDIFYNLQNVKILGGDTYLKSSAESGSCLNASNNISISGGRIELVADKPSEYLLNCYGGIDISGNCIITTPSGGRVYPADGEIDDIWDDGDRHVTDASGNYVSHIVIEEKNSSNYSSIYRNEWVNGKWYDANGAQTYKGTLSWKKNSKGWWIEDSSGWYPRSQWQKIDGKWYYFLSDGYMDYSEYRDGCWLGLDGAWIESYYGGKWSKDSTGWWYSDSSGWYPSNQWLWIDGKNYHFNTKGYCTNP